MKATLFLAALPTIFAFRISSSPSLPDPSARRIGIDFLWYGISQHSGITDLKTLAAYRADLSAGIVRFDVHWYFLESSPGLFDWTMTDAIVDAVPPDTRILFTVYCTSPWAIKPRKDGSGARLSTIMPPAAPVDYGRYRDFVRALADRYEGRVGYYQVENEVYGAPAFWMGSPDEYLALLRTAYAAIKDADPSAKVLPAAIAFGALDVSKPLPRQYRAAFDFIDLVYSEGKAYFDIADLHLYYTLDSVSDRLRWLESLMAAKGYAKPVWVTEIGGLDSRACSDPSDATEQSIDLVRRYVVAFAGKAEAVFWLSVHRTKDDEAPPWAAMSLTEDAAARIKRPAYYALKLLIEEIDGFTDVRAIADGYEFTVKGRTVLVLWSDAPRGADVSGYFPGPTVRVRRIPTRTGETIPEPSSSPAAAVPIDRAPVFVSGE